MAVDGLLLVDFAHLLTQVARAGVNHEVVVALRIGIHLHEVVAAPQRTQRAEQALHPLQLWQAVQRIQRFE